MVEEAKKWTHSQCHICGRSYPHMLDSKPVTCGRFNCLHEANNRGLLDQRSIEDTQIANSMRDFWKHQGYAD